MSAYVPGFEPLALLRRCDRWLWLAPLCAAAGVLVLARFVRGGLNLTEVTWCHLSLESVPWVTGLRAEAMDVSNAYQYGASMFLLLASASAALGFSAYVLAYATGRRRWPVVAAVLVVATLASVLFVYRCNLVVPRHEALHLQVQRITGIDFSAIVAVNFAVTMSTILAATLAFGALLVDLVPASEDTVAPIGSVRWRVRACHRLVFLCSAVLACGVLQIYALHRWASAYVDLEAAGGKSAAAAIDAMAGAAAVGAGAVYSVLMIAVFATASLPLHVVATELSHEQSGTKLDRMEWLVREGLLLPDTRALVGALLGPMVLAVLHRITERL